MSESLDKEYWSKRYEEQRTGWDIGYPSIPLKEYIAQLVDKTIRILIPGAGNAHEAEYLWELGFPNVYVIDIAPNAVTEFKRRISGFPAGQIFEGDFFEFSGSFDLILEQTFFCALEPSLRESYVSKMLDLLDEKGKLVGVLFNHPLTGEGPPFGGDEVMYRKFFSPHFNVLKLEACYNSIPARQGAEIFVHLIKN